jgi:hypothetical protein
MNFLYLHMNLHNKFLRNFSRGGGGGGFIFKKLGGVLKFFN